MSTAAGTIGWDSPNVPAAIGVSLGAGLATGIGGAGAFCPDLFKRVPQAVLLATSLALSAGVMLYVSFIEIFAKSLEKIQGVEGVSEGGAMAITTVCFFAGMGFCVLIELLVHKLNKKAGVKHEHVCAAHMNVAEANGQAHCEADEECCKAPAAVSSTGDRPDATAASSVSVEIVSGGGKKTAGEESAAEAGTLIGNKAEAASLTRMGSMTAIAIAIHNFPEGLATFLQTVVDTKVGASLGVAIAIHNIPEGLCVAMPIYYATGSKWKAFGWALASGITEPLGGLIGFAALQPVFDDMAFGVVFSMVGGMMVFIVCHELLPAAHRYMGSSWKSSAWFIAGMVIMSLSLVLFAV